MMKKTFLFFVLTLIPVVSFGQEKYEPVADSRAIVQCGNARFTVLTPKLVRMEWNEDCIFEDRATLAFVNRKLDVPDFRTLRKGKGVVIITEALKLTYSGQGKFDGNNLKIEFRMADPSASKGYRTVVWTPDSDDSGNLLGTTRTLDKCDGFKTIEPYEKGILSRDGWAVIDDSKRHLLVEDESDWKNWVASRENGGQDLYMFAYGHNYKEALGDFIKVAGRIPMPPKYVFGYWWSRYWQYSDAEFLDLARDIKGMGIPIDVMVIDMDWHKTWSLRLYNSPKDEFGESVGWTGYTWQEQLFPNPGNFLSAIRSMKIRTSLNLHPASGIQPYEESYDRFVKDYLSRTDNYDGPEGYIYQEGGYTFKGNVKPCGKSGEKAPVPFRIDDRHWADAYFNSVIHPLEKQGVDFWWLDWQQWNISKYVPELSNTFWLNRTFFDDKVRRTVSEGKMAPRPMIYHRWGGLGSHRYQIGFSGDCYCSWDVLSYLPYFTSTASNVGYGYWGHDIGGHLLPRGVNSTDPEMYTRWLQYGVFTPIFKTHSSKNAGLERRIWMFPEYYKPMKEAIRLRYSLSPYIYNAARQTFDTGVSMCRPMYYDYPEADEAYIWKKQYMFGDDILVSVIDSPVDTVTGLSEGKVWLPSGNDWYDMAHGILLKGGQEFSTGYTINENPFFVKAGSVIPMATEDVMNLQEQNNELYLTVIPGECDSETIVYEDDGTTQAYSCDYAVTRVRKSISSFGTVLKISPREGSYDGFAPDRKITVLFENVLPPADIVVNGKKLPYSRTNQEGTWTYDGSRLQTRIILETLSCEAGIEVEFHKSSEQTRDLLDGKKAVLNRMYELSPQAKLYFGTRVDAFMMLPEAFMNVAQCPSLITEHPDQAASYLRNVDMNALNETLESFEKLPAGFREKVKAQGEVRTN